MALTLKSSGPAAKAIALLAMDDDNATLREFTGKTFSQSSSMVFDTDTWKGQTMGTFRTLNNGGSNFHGVTFTDTLPVLPYGNPTRKWTFVGLFAAYAGGSFMAGHFAAGNDAYAQKIASNKAVMRVASADILTATNAWTTEGKFAHAQTYRNGALGAGNLCEMFYALEEDDEFSANGSATDPMEPSGNSDLITYGGIAGQGYCDATAFLVGWFNELTTEELNSIFADPRGTLFEASAPGGPNIAAIMHHLRQQGIC